MKDFWLSCGHHLLDRGEGGGLVVTDEYLKAHFARPELAPPPEAGVVEPPPLPAPLPRSPPAPSHRRGGLSCAGPQRRRRHAAVVSQPTRPCDPAQRVGSLRRSIRIAGGRAILPPATRDAARRLA